MSLFKKKKEREIFTRLKELIITSKKINCTNYSYWFDDFDITVTSIGPSDCRPRLTRSELKEAIELIELQQVKLALEKCKK